MNAHQSIAAGAIQNSLLVMRYAFVSKRQWHSGTIWRTENEKLQSKVSLTAQVDRIQGSSLVERDWMLHK